MGLAAIKGEGDAITYDDTSQGYLARYAHVTYGLGFIITREMYDDGLAVTKAYTKAGALAFSIRQTKETVAANVLNRAFTAAYTMGSQSDGKELCADDHPNMSGGTWRNELATASRITSYNVCYTKLLRANFLIDICVILEIAGSVGSRCF